MAKPENDTEILEPAENMVKMVVSALEADMIKQIRLYPFGDFTVVKVRGEPRRVVLGGSVYLKESRGIEYSMSNEVKEMEEKALREGKLEDETLEV